MEIGKGGSGEVSHGDADKRGEGMKTEGMKEQEKTVGTEKSGKGRDREREGDGKQAGVEGRVHGKG